MDATQIQNWMGQVAQQIRGEFDQKLNQHAAGVRAMSDRRLAAADKKLEDLGNIAKALLIERSGQGIVRIEDLPGRRVPFDFIVDIPIGNNTTSVQESSLTVSQEGPFVAVKRFATFQSALEFQVGTGASAPRFSGRSYGRYRPIHSAWDLFDQGNASFGTLVNPPPAGSVVANLELPGTMSGFRTMEFDGRILVENAGSSYPRQNISVPSPFWSAQINAPQELGCLDFFERGEVITFKVAPTHVNNPPAGNVDQFDISGTTGWPFLAGQFDRHEGIVTTGVTGGLISNASGLTTDPITRLPNGILTIGFLGYRIQQPVGPLG